MIKPLETFIKEGDLARDIAINPNDLQNAFYEQAALNVHYNGLKIKAQAQANRVKQGLEIIEAKLDRAIRDQAASEGRKITEPEIAKTIHLDSRYQRAVLRYNEAKEIAALCKEAAESFSMRRDMIVQAAKAELEERRGQLRLSGHDDMGQRAVERIKNSRQ